MDPHDHPDKTPRRILFSVKADPRRFPAELWFRFKAATEARGIRWIDALRQMIERYVRDHDERNQP